MIVVKLIGGMGNQMFQYAAGYNLGKLLNQEVFYDIGYYKIDKKRRYELRGLPVRILDEERKKGTDGRICEIQRTIIKWCFSLERYVHTNKIRNLLTEIGIYLEFDTGDIKKYPHICLRENKNIFLCGYFQNPKVFRQNYPEIRKLYQSFLEKYMVNNLDTICVHIRADDYIGNPWFHVCTQEYYNTAIGIIKTKRPNAKVLIFSDGIDYVKENIKLEYDYELCTEANPKAGMALMASCSYFVLSNSTYSWWAQELCDAEDKIVVAPSKWDGKNKNCYIYKKDWIIVDP